MMTVKEWAFLALGVWAVLFVSGLGMKAFDWVCNWTKKKK